MRPIKTAALVATSLLLTLGNSIAAPNLFSKAPTNPATQALTVLEDIEQKAADASERAFLMSRLARGTVRTTQQLPAINALKQDVNDIGKALVALDAQRNELAPWEVKLLDQLTPVAQQLASLTTAEIQTYNEHREVLFGTDYPSKSDQIIAEAKLLHNRIKDTLKLAKDQSEAESLTGKLASEPTN